VELRKRVSQHDAELWLQIAATEREEIKDKLPGIILAEPKSESQVIFADEPLC
jgi:hypothetical protein